MHIGIVRLLLKSQTSDVVKNLTEALWQVVLNTVTKNVQILLVCLHLWKFDPLPWQPSRTNVHQRVQKRLKIISPTSCKTKIRVDRSEQGCPIHSIMFCTGFLRNMHSCHSVLVESSQPKVNQVTDFLVRTKTIQDVSRLYVSMDVVGLMQSLQPLYQLKENS
jgi:hypothetical protein